MDLQALGQQVGGRPVIGRFHDAKNPESGPCRGLLSGHQMPHHVVGSGHTLYLLDAGEAGELPISARRRMPQCANALSDQVERRPLLGVLRHEDLVQAVEVRTGDVPVEVMGHQVQRVTVSQEPLAP